jgi:hypothetical protein
VNGGILHVPTHELRWPHQLVALLALTRASGTIW